TFWQPIAALRFGADPSDSAAYAVLGTLSGVAVLLGSVAVLRWGEKFPGGPAALAGTSMLVRGGAMMLFALVLSPLGLGLGLTVAYFALASSNVPHDTLLHEAVPSARRSSMLSVHSLVFFLGIAVASGPLGWLATRTGPQLALLVAAAVTAAASLSYVAVARVHGTVKPLDTGHGGPASQMALGEGSDD